MDLTINALPPLAAFASQPFGVPERPRLATFTAWQHALHGTTAVQIQPELAPRAVAPIVLPEPALTEKPAVIWQRAVKIFTPPEEDQMIRLDQTVWEDEFKATSDWNTKPSRVENFLARYDKNHTLTTLAVVVLLLLWIY